MAETLPLTDDSVLPRIAWSSVLTAGTFTATPATVDTDGAAEQVTDWRPWTFWRPTGVGARSLEVNLGGTKTVNAWAIYGHDAAGTIGMDTWNADTLAWVIHSETVAAGDCAVVYLIGDPVATTKLRFRFPTLTHLAVLWAGTDVEIPEGFMPGWTDPLFALRADVEPEISRDGVWLGAAVKQWTAKLGIDVKNLEAAWVRDYWLPFLRTCCVQPFFLHWNTEDHPDGAAFCYNATFGGTAYASRGFVDVSVSCSADTGLDRRVVPVDDAPALLLESPDGPLLLEG